MLERTQLRVLPLVNRAPDLTPAAQACCGVCRGCVTTNLVTVAAAAATGAAAYVARAARQAVGRARHRRV